MLVSSPKRYFELERLHVYDGGSRNSVSGIQATVFGATSCLGGIIGAHLTGMGSQVVYPHRNHATVWDRNMREVKVSADLGYKAFMRLSDFTSHNELSYAMKESNVVVNCIGSKMYETKEADFEESNIKVPMAIAKAVKANPKIKRHIYISQAGADPNSASKRLRTKWIGEQEVKNIDPNVTILRPTCMFNTLH
jgi:uncharacterized protein YbjT (DUF2867 family)